MDNKDAFFDGSIMGYYIKINEDGISDMIQNNKLLGKKENIEDILFEIDDEYFITLLNEMFFSGANEFERTILFVKPALNDDDLSEILETLKYKIIFVLDNSTFKSTDNDTIYGKIFSNDTEYTGTQIVCEGYNVINDIKILIGTNNAEFHQYCPNSLNVKYINQYQFNSCGNSEESNEYIDVLYPNYFPIERTLAMIKPTAYANNCANDIINSIQKHNFTIIARKTLKLSLPQAQTFYAVMYIYIFSIY